MAKFIEVKVLGGVTYIRADQVAAVAQTDQTRSNVFLLGNSQGIGSAEPAGVVVKRVIEALAPSNAGGPHGDAG